MWAWALQRIAEQTLLLKPFCCCFSCKNHTLLVFLQLVPANSTVSSMQTLNLVGLQAQSGTSPRGVRQHLCIFPVQSSSQGSTSINLTAYLILPVWDPIVISNCIDSFQNSQFPCYYPKSTHILHSPWLKSQIFASSLILPTHVGPMAVAKIFIKYVLFSSPLLLL